MVEKHSNSKNVLLLPLMANGHLKPFLELATQLTRRATTALTFTILSTPLNIQLLRQMSMAAGGGSSDTGGVKLVELPFESSQHGLPDQAENANVLPPTAIVQLLYASKALEAPLRKFIAEEIIEKEGCPPLCIISDMILGWPMGVAHSFGSLAFTFTTGAFITHCGWNSVLESLIHGVPMIGWPLGAEQAFNSKMLEELGVVAELTRGIEGNLSKNNVNRVLNIVLDRQGKGLEMKRKAIEVSQTIKMATKEEGDHKGSSFKALDDFLNTLLHRFYPSSVQF